MIAAKKGPPLLEDDSTSVDTTVATITLGQRLSRLGSLIDPADTGGFAFKESYELGLRRRNLIQHSSSRLGAPQQQVSRTLRWRTSIASSQYRVPVQFRCYRGEYTTPWRFGDFSTEDEMVERTAGLMSYETTGIVYDDEDDADYYGAMETTNLLGEILGTEIQHIESMPVWHQVWWAVMLIRLRDFAPGGATWKTRPIQAISYSTKKNGLTTYRRLNANIFNSSDIVIELDQREINLVPVLTFLLGARPNTFDLDYGTHHGAQREPHLLSKVPVAFNYHFLCRDLLVEWPCNEHPAIDPALPGLAAGVQAHGQSVDNFSEELLQGALQVMARSRPVAGDCEAAWWLAATSLFAENFRGVQEDAISGDSRCGAGYGFMLQAGDAQIPAGSWLCCLFTRLTEESEGTMETRLRARQLLSLSSCISVIRASCEPLDAAFQRAARQLSLTVPIFFDRVDPADSLTPSSDLVSLNPNPHMPYEAKIALARAHRGLCETGYQRPSSIWGMTEDMCVVLYKTVLPKPLLFVTVGNHEADPHLPFYREPNASANVGECFSSVHPGQLATGLLSGDCIGLAGIPSMLGNLAGSFKLDASHGLIVPRGQIASKVLDNGDVTYDAGVNMLGHAIVLRRDAEPMPGKYHIALTTIPQHVNIDRPPVCTATFRDLHRDRRLAFTPDIGGGWEGKWDDPGDVELDQQELHADFELLTSKDLEIGLDQTESNMEIFHNAKRRRGLPGYIGASILNPTVPGIENTNSPKRQRINP